MAENILQPCSTPEVFYNSKMKIYRDGTTSILYASRPIFKSKYFVPVNKKIRYLPNEYKTSELSRMDSVLRAKRRIYDIARQNDFDYFITWTFNNDIVDRFDPIEVKKKAQLFLNNMMKRRNLKYLIIPEFHEGKKGSRPVVDDLGRKAIHYHGFISGEGLQFIDSGKTTKKGQPILNMPQWIYGFSTAVRLDENKVRAANYITKYITKDTKKIHGKYYFAGGKGLVRDTDVQYFDSDFLNLELKEYHVQNTNIKLKYDNT